MKYTINNNCRCEYIINKSKFIVHLMKISDVSLIKHMIISIKDEDKNATHYCYAYIIDSYEKCSDDKEPSGTAGLPILNVLKKNNMNHILCVVVRYFGGIKLGAGGLVRAYSNTVSQALKTANIVHDIKYVNIIFEFDYNVINDMEFILKGYNITKNFNKKIKFVVDIPEHETDNIINKVNSLNKIVNITYTKF